METFGEFLKKKREELGVSQTELAQKTGIDRTYLSMLENKGNPGFATISEIARALGITLEDFFREQRKEAEPPVIAVQFNEPAEDRKMAQRMITSFTLPLPIIKDPKPLNTKVIEERDIEGYILIDRNVFTYSKEDMKLVVWLPKDLPGIAYAIVDMSVKTIDMYGTCLFDLDGEVQIRRVVPAVNGVLLVPFPERRIETSNVLPIMVNEKKVDSLKILGRVIMLAQHL